MICISYILREGQRLQYYGTYKWKLFSSLTFLDYYIHAKHLIDQQLIVITNLGKYLFNVMIFDL